jgi:cell wall-associated NlpC family hydrolase
MLCRVTSADTAGSRSVFAILRRESMKRRYPRAILFAAIALLFASTSGFAKNNSASSKSSATQKKIKTSSQPAPKSNPTSVYIVRAGDSIYEIARRFKTTREALIAANRLSGNKIKIGQQLKVPVLQRVAAGKKTPKTESPVNPNQTIMYAGVSQQADTGKASDADTQSLPHRLVEAGFGLIGVKYRFSGLSEKSGLDCSGLVKTLFSKFNIELPRSSREQYKQGEKIDQDKLAVGDLLFFSSGGNLPTHVGIYVGNDKVLHAARTAKQVVVSDLNKIWNSMRYLGARRIMDLWWEEPASTPEPEKE